MENKNLQSLIFMVKIILGWESLIKGMREDSSTIQILGSADPFFRFVTSFLFEIIVGISRMYN